MQDIRALEVELKEMLVRALELEDIEPADIDTETPLFVDGLGLDSIDAIELAERIQQDYGVTIDDNPERNLQIFSSIKSLAAFVSENRTK